MDIPRRLIAAALMLAALAFVARAADGPLTNGANILARTDLNGYLLAAAQTYSAPDGPRRPLANTLVRTDANGYLIVTNPSGFRGDAETTVTTTGNIDNLSFSNATLIRMNNASDATIRGLAAGTAGQRVTIVSIGAGHVYLAHQNANSTAANRLINTVTTGNTPLAAGFGAATLQYDDTTDRWRLVDHTQGAFIDIAYAGTDFTANTGAWTVDSGDVTTFAYYLVGSQLTVILTAINTSTSLATSFVSAKLPLGLTAAKVNRAPFNYIEGVAAGVGMFSINVSGTTINFFTNALGSTNWAAGTNDHNYYFNNPVAVN